MASTDSPSQDRARTRRSARAMFAAVVAATDLPMPYAIRHQDSSDPCVKILALTFLRIADAAAWSQHLGGRTGTYVNEGRRYIDEGLIDWHGWHVQLSASEPVEPDDLPDADRQALTEIAEERP